MSLEGIEKNFKKIKELAEQYDKLLKERKETEDKVESLKGKYSEGKSRDVFSEHNKKLVEIKKSVEKIKKRIKILSGNIRKGVDEEIENVKAS